MISPQIRLPQNKVKIKLKEFMPHKKKKDTTRSPLKYFGLLFILLFGASLVFGCAAALVRGACYGFTAGPVSIVLTIIGAALILAAIVATVIFAINDRSEAKKEQEAIMKEAAFKQDNPDPSKLLEQLLSKQQNKEALVNKPK